jgi:hypothetical protein
MGRIILTFVVAAAGMIVGQWVGDQWRDVAKPLTAQTSETLTTQNLEIVNAGGKRVILLGTSAEGLPGIWFFDAAGKVRLNLGIYPDGNSFVVLNDQNELATQILRTVGAKNAPVVVMKSGGQDRIVMGLNFTDANPFFVFYDDKGAKTNVFGDY